MLTGTQVVHTSEADILQRHIDELVCIYVCKTPQGMFSYKKKYLFGYSFNETARTVGRAVATEACAKCHLNN